MPLILPTGLPAIQMLQEEGTPVRFGAGKPDVRIALLNLMPIKESTELDFIRVLNGTELTVQLELMKLRSHTSKHCSPEHMERFYRFSDEMMQEHWDGFIITGAPLEQYAYEEVRYWPEMQQIFNWARSKIPTTLYVCWAGFAGLYHFYGIDKHDTPEKVFGIYPHTTPCPTLPLFQGFDDEYLVPHSRHIEILREEILAASRAEYERSKCAGQPSDAVTIVSESPEAGVHMVMARGGRDFYITGHSEYAPLTLDTEYKRDLGKGLHIIMPQNYYRDDDPSKGVLVKWRANARLLYQNWLHHYVYRNKIQQA